MDNFAEDCLAVRIETTKGPVIIGTTYRPPRREDLPIEDMKLLRKNVPVYTLADLNVRHRFLSHGYNNDAGRILNNMINQDLAVFVGPDFNTRVGQDGLSRTDTILRNRCAFLNHSIREGDLTTSGHIPVVFTVSTTAIIREATKKKQYKKTNWDRFKRMVENDITKKNDELDLNRFSKKIWTKLPLLRN